MVSSISWCSIENSTELLVDFIPVPVHKVQLQLRHFGDFGPSQSAPAEKATRVLTEDDLASEEEDRDICEDIRSECARFGNLENVVVPREGAGTGSAFLEYSTEQEAGMAKSQLHGRTFGERVVSAVFLDEDTFKAGDYSR